MEAWLTGLRKIAWTDLAIVSGFRIVGALLILLIGVRLVKWIAGMAERGLLRAHVETITAQFLRKVIYVTGLVIIVLTALTATGVSMTPVFAVLGAAGLAIGLALKDSLSNIASGVMLVMLKPFRVGDLVNIANESGKVEEVSIFQTKLRGADNQLIVLPNSLITTDSIINLTPGTTRRIELIIGIGYGDDIDAARAAALDVMRSDSRVLPSPAADVLVYALADNSVNLGVRCHVANSDYLATKCDLTERIKKAFDHAGVSIPFPQRDVHMYHHAVAADGTITNMQPGTQTDGQRPVRQRSNQPPPPTPPALPSQPSGTADRGSPQDAET